MIRCDNFVVIRDAKVLRNLKVVSDQLLPRGRTDSWPRHSPRPGGRIRDSRDRGAREDAPKEKPRR